MGSRRQIDLLRPETELLLGCTASGIGCGSTDRVARTIERGIDWGSFRSMAWNHGVSPLVYRGMAAAVVDGCEIPGTALAQMRETAAAIAATNLRLTAELFRIIDAFSGAGMPAIAYKGPVLARRAYGDVALRHFSDLDLLVKQADLRRAEAILRSLGYRLHGPGGSGTRNAVLRWGHHLGYVRDGSLVEVHWRFHKPLFGPSFEDAARRDAVTDELGGRPLRVLSRRDELLLLATHGSWHGWSQLLWVCDLVKLHGQPADSEVGMLLQTARARGQLRPLLLGFQLARALLGVEIPRIIDAEIRRHSAVVQAARIARRRMDEGRGADFGSGRLQLALRERIRDKVSFTLRALFLPNPTDLASLPVGDRFLPIHYVVRPLRIALKYRPRW